MTRDTSLDIWRESREDNGVGVVIVGLLLLLEVNCCPIGEISEEMIAQEVIPFSCTTEIPLFQELVLGCGVV